MPIGSARSTFDREIADKDRRQRMHETYRTWGREHELDLEREARNRRLATALPGRRDRVKNAPEPKQRRWGSSVLRPLGARLAR